MRYLSSSSLLFASWVSSFWHWTWVSSSSLCGGARSDWRVSVLTDDGGEHGWWLSASLMMVVNTAGGWCLSASLMVVVNTADRCQHHWWWWWTLLMVVSVTDDDDEYTVGGWWLSASLMMMVNTAGGWWLSVSLVVVVNTAGGWWLSASLMVVVNTAGGWWLSASLMVVVNTADGRQCHWWWWWILLVVVSVTEDGDEYCWWLMVVSITDDDGEYCWWLMVVSVIEDGDEYCWWLMVVSVTDDDGEYCWWLMVVSVTDGGRLQSSCVTNFVCWWASGCLSPCAFSVHHWLASCLQHCKKENRVSVSPCQYIAYPQQVLCSAFSWLQVFTGATRPQNRTARAKSVCPNGKVGGGGGGIVVSLFLVAMTLSFL